MVIRQAVTKQSGLPEKSGQAETSFIENTTELDKLIDAADQQNEIDKTMDIIVKRRPNDNKSKLTPIVFRKKQNCCLWSKGWCD